MKTIKNLTADQIRKSILQLAIQGKLVKQDPNDEPASELVKRIYEEKQRLIKEGKLKKDKNESYIYKGDDNCYYEKIGKEVRNITDELPFEIPNNWTWARFPSIVDFKLGKTPERHNQDYWNDAKYPWVSIADMREKETIYVTKERISENALNKCFKSILSSSGTLIMSFKLTVGRVSILGMDAVHNEAIISIIPIYDKDNSIKNWLFNILGIITNLADQTDAIKGSTLNKDKLSSLLIPIPSISEQQRIISKLYSFEPLIKEYEEKEKQLSNLESSFESRLKASVLQYAIEGKLVKQDSYDEPASVLLERIKKEKERLIREGKIKRDKHESKTVVGDDKNYYENLPHGWCLASLDLFGYYKKGPFGSSLTKSLFVDEKTPNRVKVYEQKNAIQHNYQLGNYYISKNKYDEMRGFSVFPGDIIVSCAGTIGEIYQLPIEAPIGIINQALMKITLFYNHIAPYYIILLKDKLYELSKSAKGTAIKNIPSFDKLKPAKVLLPPENEQIRILNQLKKIFDLLL